jgi:transcriptional regulator with XRE-family HTH domain
MQKTTPPYRPVDLETSAEETAARFIREVEDTMRFRGVTKAELARRMGISRSVVTRLFTGSSNLTIRRMTAIARALGCELVLDVRRPRGPALHRGLKLELQDTGNEE